MRDAQQNTDASVHALTRTRRVALCARPAGAVSGSAIAVRGRAKPDRLRGHVPPKQGIASHHPFGRVFAALDLGLCDVRWMSGLCPAPAGQMLALDGKAPIRAAHASSVGAA